MWFIGVCVALLPLGYGVRCLYTGQARFFGRGAYVDLNGSAAIALGIAWVSVGAFIQFHWFWGLHPRLEPLSYVFKALAALVFLGSFG